MTAGKKRKTSVPVFCTAPVPGGLPAVGSVRTLATLSPRSLRPSGSSEPPSRTLSTTVFARPEMCEAGREEPFDELPPWIFSPTLTRHRPKG